MLFIHALFSLFLCLAPQGHVHAMDTIGGGFTAKAPVVTPADTIGGGFKAVAPTVTAADTIGGGF